VIHQPIRCREVEGGPTRYFSLTRKVTLRSSVPAFQGNHIEKAGTFSSWNPCQVLRPDLCKSRRRPSLLPNMSGRSLCLDLLVQRLFTVCDVTRLFTVRCLTRLFCPFPTVTHSQTPEGPHCSRNHHNSTMLPTFILNCTVHIFHYYLYITLYLTLDARCE
jgi:hypothetical protein